MKLKYMMILAGLLVGAAPAMSFAACSPACGAGEVCRITSQGPPTVYQCKKETATYGRSPTGPRAVQGAGGTGGASMARSAGPNNKNAKANVAPKRSIQSPRDVASGQATGRRQHKP
jgi:hypothetical protein